ncbi:sensor histidine kinase [Bacillus carboniphilus]|uniref:histidine kinase n=1 Tax=Bacillus carboniphilus TaxID=86663 RepID=A0ABN0W7V6_9BACI
MIKTKLHIYENLELHKETLLERWDKKALKSPTDPNPERVLLNGETMFLFLQESIMTPIDKMEPKIERLAKRVAEERVQAGINMGDFIYNVSMGRTEIFNHLFKIDDNENREHIQVIFENMNQCFDQFMFHAVNHYAKLKDRIIEEKNSFINQSHKDRLTLLGQMTSSFIHEFRNPLTSIQGFVQLLRSDYKNVPYLDIIASEIEQLNFRISQFLLLSKKELIGKEKSTVFLHELFEELITFLYPSLLSAKVEIEKEILEDITIYGYIDELRQVFMNILFNAIDVLQNHRKDPKIQILTSKKENNIVIELTNNGPTIPPELLRTIFEPFVTTKQLGTGLGLFVCKEIIERHKGTLECFSNEEETTFRVMLPLIKQ